MILNLWCATAVSFGWLQSFQAVELDEWKKTYEMKLKSSRFLNRLKKSRDNFVFDLFWDTIESNNNDYVFKLTDPSGNTYMLVIQS